MNIVTWLVRQLTRREHTVHFIPLVHNILLYILRSSLKNQVIVKKLSSKSVFKKNVLKHILFLVHSGYI